MHPKCYVITNCGFSCSYLFNRTAGSFEVINIDLRFLVCQVKKAVARWLPQTKFHFDSERAIRSAGSDAGQGAESANRYIRDPLARRDRIVKMQSTEQQFYMLSDVHVQNENSPSFQRGASHARIERFIYLFSYPTKL